MRTTVQHPSFYLFFLCKGLWLAKTFLREGFSFLENISQQWLQDNLPSTLQTHSILKREREIMQSSLIFSPYKKSK